MRSTLVILKKNLESIGRKWGVYSMGTPMYSHRLIFIFQRSQSGRNVDIGRIGLCRRRFREKRQVVRDHRFGDQLVDENRQLAAPTGREKVDIRRRRERVGGAEEPADRVLAGAEILRRVVHHDVGRAAQHRQGGRDAVAGVRVVLANRCGVLRGNGALRTRVGVTWGGGEG